MINEKIKVNLDSLQTRREWYRHKIKDGNNFYRILPPFGDSSNGYPFKKWQIIWGLINPEDGRRRPYASSLTSEKKCPVAEYVYKLKAKAETIKASMQAAGDTDERIKQRLEPLNKVINDLSPKTIYVYNAVDKNGQIGLLELKSTAHKKMKEVMLQYINDYEQDPTSLNSEEDDSGVWFNITRSGQGRDTEYDVKKNQIKTKNAAGKIVFEDDRSPLPKEVVETFARKAYDLSAIYQVKTYDELQEILEANIPFIVETCPDANLDDEAVVAKSTTLTKPKPTTTKKQNIALNLNDADDLDERVSTPNKFMDLDIDDDFMAEADAILGN
jgi:hypothetical protein